MKKDLRLFKNGFVYVFLVSANTFCIATLFWAGIVLFGFLISFLWAANVKRISTSNIIDRIIYASGAMFGGLLGVWLSNFLKQIVHTL
uniref:hypothetical protein n=1 Tax=uncultured Draconibacterium sp. TaxID=1573823 RepID=UPI0032177FB3